jgi:hypothetical protein
MGHGEEASEQGAGSKAEEFSSEQEQHPAPLPLFNAQCPMPHAQIILHSHNFISCIYIENLSGNATRQITTQEGRSVAHF